MATFDGIPLETLSAWLSEAQIAYHALSTGTQTVSVASGEDRVSFTAADPGKLKSYISELQTAIASRTAGDFRRKGVYLTGGKGL